VESRTDTDPQGAFTMTIVETTWLANNEHPGADQEAQELLVTLAERRFFLRHTVRDLTDEQATARPTASQLCLGGLIKHVGLVEQGWINFIVEGTSAQETAEGADTSEFARGFQLAAGETLAEVLAEYENVADRTETVVRGLSNLDFSHPLPAAPWFEPGASWSARRVLLHIIGETAHHAGHADILRETLDGAKTMG
jgi:uncharacterized damage-inducible protein DinB